MTARAGDSYPWFEIQGRALGDNGDDVHIVLPKCKLSDGFEGEFRDGEFYIQSCSGIAVDNGTKLYDIVQHETAAALPTT